MIKINNLCVAVDQQAIIKNLNLDVMPGQVHAIMGPNGSGKSSLAQTLMGHPLYEIQQGDVVFDGKSIVDMPVHERSHAGIFLALQQPLAIPGVTVFQLLKEMYTAAGHADIEIDEMHKLFAGYLEQVGLAETFLERGCNDNFSGGEKKRFEIVQMLVLKPKLIILDEIDSGLDVDALKEIGRAIKTYLDSTPDAMCLMITHYRRILDYVEPDFVHILVNGTIVHTGDVSLSNNIEEKGYEEYV